MKKVERCVGLLLAFFLALGLWSPTVAATKQFTSDWIYWSQGASGIGGKMNSSGCRVVAAAKMLKEMGVADSSFDPDVYANWAYERGYYGSKSKGRKLSDYIGEQGPGGTAPVAYAKAQGKTITYHGERALPSGKNEQDKKIMEWLNAGYYVIAGSSGHQAYVARAISLEKGCAYLANSSSSVKTQSECKKWCLHKFTSRKGYTYVRLYSMDSTQLSATVSFSNYAVRKLTETSAEPYATATATGGLVKKVGMWIGPSEDRLYVLGTDNGKASAKKNMWYNTDKYGYPLEPGTTYYYQPFAEVDGKLYEGDIKSFTTKGEKVMPITALTPTPDPEPEQSATPTPDPEPEQSVTPVPDPEPEQSATPTPTPVDNRSWQDQGWTSKKPTESDTLKITDTRTVTDKAGYTTYTYYHYWAKKDGKTKMSYGNTYWKNYEEVTVTTAYPYYKTYDGKYKGYKSPSTPEGKHGTIWWLKSTNEVPAQTHVEYRYSVYK